MKTFSPYCFGTVFQHLEAASWAIVPSKILNKLDSKFLHYVFFFLKSTLVICFWTVCSFFYFFFKSIINRFIGTRSGQIQLGSICSFQIISKNLWAIFWNTSISVWFIMSEIHWPLFSLSHLAESVGISHCPCLAHCMHTQMCASLCDPMDCSPPGSPVHGISQARILQWVAISSSRGSSRPRDQTGVSRVSCSGRQILYHWATWETSLWHIKLA